MLNSFKVGISREFYDMLNCWTFWPKRIVFRRFNSKQSNNRARKANKEEPPNFVQIVPIEMEFVALLRFIIKMLEDYALNSTI